MSLHIVVRRHCNQKLLVRIKCHDLYSFKKGLILLCQSILHRDEYHIYMAQLSLQFLLFHKKKTSMPNPVKGLEYIKCYSSSSCRSVKSPSNSIRHNCQKICGWTKRPETILETRKKATFLKVINNPLRFC